MSEEQQNWPDAILKSSCLKPLKARLIYEGDKVLDYISDDGALFLISDEVDPEPSSITIKNFSRLKELSHGYIVFQRDVLMIEGYRMDVSLTKVFSTSDLSLQNFDESFYFKIKEFVKERYSCDLYPASSRKVCDVLLKIEAESLLNPQKIKDLIGFGIGMTPSGDDFLVGLMASLKGSYYFNYFGKIIAKNFYRTNKISGEFLRCAASGEFSATLAGLINAGNLHVSPEKYLYDILKKGHTSGIESLLGFLKGLEIRKTYF
ncbi:MAG: DUF2877 domain-containing protein [Nitrososphaeria archaeon]